MSSSPVERLHSQYFPTGKKILYCALNWGLGHASRSVPIIQALIERNNEVTLASDGLPMEMLRQNFPALPFYELPPYNVRYPRASIFQNILLQSFQIQLAMRREHAVVKALVDKHGYEWIISDNRPGCYDKRSQCIFITHQTEPYHPRAAVRWLFKWVSQFYFSPFQQIWIPDDSTLKLSGDLSHRSFKHPETHFIGLCSSMDGKKEERNNSIAVILSGPEPQRTLVEQKLWDIALQMPERTFIWVRGTQNAAAPVQVPAHITLVDVAHKDQINHWLNTCSLVICRSGYTSLMDIAVSGCKALLIPTPGQTEQEYLARRHADRWPWIEQDKVSASSIRAVLQNENS